jgi:endonuclease YncB( thermonuclease family)
MGTQPLLKRCCRPRSTTAEKRQPFAQKSKASLSELAYRKTVIVITGKTDRYGRIVGSTGRT